MNPKNTITRRLFLRSTALASLSLGVFPSLSYASKVPVKGKRIGIIGLDISHAISFTKTINSNPADFNDYQIVAAYPFGSQTIASAAERIPKYTQQVQTFGVKIVNSIADLLQEVDVVLLETNDGRMHLAQALEVINAGKPLFIDKPIAASLSDAAKIFKAAKEKNVPVFSSSALRYTPNVQTVLSGEYGKVNHATTYSPAILEPTHPDLYWYGIHGVEMLFAVMGPDCESVTRTSTANADVVTGVWKDGRTGTFTGLRDSGSNFGGTCFCENKVVELGPFTSYTPLIKTIITFFETGVAPVSSAETMQILAFMDAADLSKKKSKIIRLKDIYKKAGLSVPQ